MYGHVHDTEVIESGLPKMIKKKNRKPSSFPEDLSWHYAVNLCFIYPEQMDMFV